MNSKRSGNPSPGRCPESTISCVALLGERFAQGRQRGFRLGDERLLGGDVKT